MKNLFLFLLTLAATGAQASPVLWYGGDPDLGPTADGLASERNASVDNAQSYDNFTLPAPSLVDGVFGNFEDTARGTLTKAFFDIRVGVSQSHDGVSIASGVINVTATYTGTGIFGMNIYLYQGSITPLILDSGTYFLAISPISPVAGRDFISNTLGANAVNNLGHPNRNQYLYSSFFHAKYQNWYSFGDPGEYNMSYGVTGTPVPEPITGLSLALATVAMTRRRKRKAAPC